MWLEAHLTGVNMNRGKRRAWSMIIQIVSSRLSNIWIKRLTVFYKVWMKKKNLNVLQWFIFVLEFSSICHSSTEFHFDSLSDQLSKIQKNVTEKRKEMQNERSEWVTFYNLKSNRFFGCLNSSCNSLFLACQIITVNQKKNPATKRYALKHPP